MFPAVEHVGCERGLLVGQSGGWLELDSGTLCSRQNKDFLGPTANGQEAVDMEPTQTGAREVFPPSPLRIQRDLQVAQAWSRREWTRQ